MIEDVEAKLNGEIKNSSNTENLEVATEENVDEDITAEAKASKDMVFISKKNKRHKHMKRQ